MWDLFIPFRAYRAYRAIVASIFLVIIGAAWVYTAIVYRKPAGNYGWQAKARWNHGVLFADISHSGSDLTSKDSIEVLWVSLDGVSGDQPIPDPSQPGAITIPFHNYTGLGNTKSPMDIRYRTERKPGAIFQMDQFLQVDVPPKGSVD